MKKILFIFSISFANLLYSQPGSPTLIEFCPQKTIVPLRTWTEIPEEQCYYLKDTNNELQDYVGTWTGTWNNKTIFLQIVKITDSYNSTFKYYKDFLIAKFKVLDSSGNILFDNTNLPNHQAKITGGKFRKTDDKYSLIYIDPDLCDTSGSIRINFTDLTKTQLQWWYGQNVNWIDTDCFFYGYPENKIPEPLPKNIILTKQ